MLAVLRPLGAGDDDAGRVVGFDAAIQQVQRLADEAAVDDVLDREALLVIGLRVVRGVVAVKHLYVRHLLRRRAVIVHVAHKGRRKALPGALPAIGAVVQHVAANRRRRARSGAADAHLREAVHRAEDRDGLAAAGLDQPDRDADQRLGRGAAADHVHVEIEPDAEVAGDERGARRVAARIIEHAVDVGGLQPGIEDRVAHGPGAERPRRLVRASRVGRLADPDDRVFVAQIFRRRRIDLLSR